jgi:hypothetical protein
MRRLANLFLILFLFSAGLNFCAELLPGSPLVGLRQLAELLTYLLAMPVYVGLGLHRQLEKRIFAPLLLVLGWGLLEFWPLESLAGDHYRLYAAAGQLLLDVLGYLAIGRLLTKQRVQAGHGPRLQGVHAAATHGHDADRRVAPEDTGVASRLSLFRARSGQNAVRREVVLQQLQCGLGASVDQRACGRV